MHLGKAYLAPYEESGLGCIVHVQCTCKWFAHCKNFARTYRSNGEAPLIPNSQVTCMHTLPRLKNHWGCRSCGVQVARARGGKPYLTRDPPVLGNFDLLTPNLVHLWNSMSVIRRYMSFRDRVHGAPAMHVHYVYA